MSRNKSRKKRRKPSTSQAAHHTASRGDTRAPAAAAVPRRRDTGTAPAAVRHRSSTETRSAFATSEFIAYAGAVLAVVLTSLAVDADGRGGADPFGTDTALRCLALLTVGYVVARGLAKSDSRERRVRQDTHDVARTGTAPAPDAPGGRTRHDEHGGVPAEHVQRPADGDGADLRP